MIHLLLLCGDGEWQALFLFLKEETKMKESLQMVNEMRSLIAKIKKADVAYYKKDQPLITDREYDMLFDRLAEMEAQTGIVLSGSPIHSVAGEILESLNPVQHGKPMLSAAKTKSVEEFVGFAKGQSVVLSWKLDGLTLVLRYENGAFKQAITRGREGIIGEDVTHTVRTFLNVPMTVPYHGSFEVRGEGVISWENFRKINEALEEKYSHPRNLAAGSTRKLDAEEAKKCHLEFIAFELIERSDEIPVKTKSFQMETLKEMGFDVVPYTLFLKERGDLANLPSVVRAMSPEDFKYPVDGLIMEYDDIAYGRSLGATGHHENRMMALKWADTLYETRFTGVELATTRTGMVSITGLFEPVEIDGSTVSRAYLHNLDVFEGLQLGIGDTVKVYKANMIIPQIAYNVNRSNTYELPLTCPCCGGPLVVKRSSGGTRQLFCENPQCAAKLVQKFSHFCEKNRMNIEGLSERTLEKFIGHGWICNFGDLYTLEQYRDEIVRTESFGVKSFERLQASIEKSRHCTLAQFIAALGIPMVGRHAGRDLDHYFNGSWDSFERAIQDGFDFRSLPDFGGIMHDNIYAWYADENEAKLWRPVLKHLDFVQGATCSATSLKR